MKSFGFLAGTRVGQALVFFPVFAAIVIAAIYNYRAIDREFTESALSRRAALSYLAAAVLTEKFDRLADIGIALASRVRFRELAESGNWAEAIKILGSVPADFPFIDRITLNDPRGTLMADIPAAPDIKGQNFAHRDWYQAVMRTGQPSISQIYRRAAPPQINVFVAATPIRSSKGEILGVLVLQVRLDRFFGWIARIETGPGGFVYVTDRRGMLAAHPKFPPQGDLVDYSSVPAVQRILQGERGVATLSNSVDKSEQVVAYEPLTRHGWGVVLEQPAATVFALRDEQLRRVLYAYGLILILMLSAAYLAVRFAAQRMQAAEDDRVKARFLQTTQDLEAEVSERKRAQHELAKYAERLNILHEIDQSIMAVEEPEAIAEAALQRLSKLIAVPRAIVNLFDLATNEAEWLAAVGRHRAHRGPGVRFSMRLMGDVEGLRRGEPQMIDTAALPPGPEVDALLASGIDEYMVVPMIAGGELIGGLSFGGAKGQFPMEHVGIAREVAAQLAIAIAHARLYERVKRQAEELERRVAERTEQLEATTRMLQSIIDNLPGAVSLFDRHLMMTTSNDKFRTLLGLPDELFRDGPPSFETLIRFNARNGEYGPGDPDQITAGIVERARHVVAHCFERVRPDGTVLEIRGTPMPDGGFVTYYSDITERKRIEDALREREERFRLLVGAVKDYAILMLDTDGRVVTWNEGAERIKGYRADEIVGQHFSRFYSREDLANGKPEHELAVATAKGRYEEEGWRVRKDGSPFWASVIISSVRDEAGTLRGFSKVTRDLTQRKHAEEEIRLLNEDLERRAAQLEITNKELEGFSYSVSHDLRSPLRAIDGYSQIFEEDYADKLDEEGKRLLAVIRDSSQKMAMLIDDLLDFSRLGRQAMVTTTVDMNALLDEVIKEVTPAGSTASSQIVVAKLPMARGDRALLKQVWINLLSNAIKFSGAKDAPVIDVAGDDNAAEVVFRMADNGVGFDMKYYKKLFGVFQRLHSTDEFPGTGVGLAIVHRVVSRHGGRVWAEGKLNEGAVFFFALPHGEQEKGEQNG